jgi:hypothetical protein
MGKYEKSYFVLTDRITIHANRHKLNDNVNTRKAYTMIPIFVHTNIVALHNNNMNLFSIYRYNIRISFIEKYYVLSLRTRSKVKKSQRYRI